MSTPESKRATLSVALATSLVAIAWSSAALAQDPHTHHRAAASATAQDVLDNDPAEAPDPVTPAAQQPAMDHSKMDHSNMDHSKMDHAAMGHGASGSGTASEAPRTPIPPVSEADLRAAFPDLHAHAMHGDSVHSYWSMDRLEAWDADEHGTGTAWEALAWIGGDVDRIWLRSEGERSDAGTESADLEVLYGHGASRWWDVVAGIRHDFGGEGPSQTFAALGVQGLAPYKFEVSGTAYLGESGQSAATLEAEYDTLLTNRLILQWSAEAEFNGKDDPRRGIGSGLGHLEAGARLRYEFSRRFAPYVGVSWERAYGGTADYRAAEGEDRDDTRLVLGVRFWF
ncbi:copper resistance protein B [Marilutibacter aestuarii]|uniref:Copper resistance protein B n=1 Tax=Marilutibacter aestuarii TaxID=1706195 RepID=A0A508AL01_9GAMM|nr:copper resistance protein B [Lysobacter aestuarii]TQD46342.1 copper resistance protein B [Lysobacter aestuarii]